MSNLLKTKRFIKDFKKLPHSIQIKVFERLDMFAIDQSNPLLSTHDLNPPWQGYRSINITGDIRLIYRQEGSFYRLARVGSHSELYN